jgi:predicted dithiol-disulfide oxidoreductase (DUF899 family)
MATSAALHELRFPNESAEYRAARNTLLEAEIALRRQTEAVAELRRALPQGGVVPEDYVFAEGEDARAVRLSELFGDKQVLLLYSYMYSPAMALPCPSCTSILDGLDGQAPHITQRVALAVVARSPIARIRQVAAQRGWTRMRLVSSADNSYHTDYFGESAEGRQRPILNIFTKAPDGEIRHANASELMFVAPEPGQDPRHVDALWPMWAALDLTPVGRGAETQPKLNYG